MECISSNQELEIFQLKKEILWYILIIACPSMELNSGNGF